MKARIPIARQGVKPDHHSIAPGYGDSARAAKWAVFSCATILALCLVVGLPTIAPHNYFLGDDFGLVHHLHNLPLHRFLSYFVSDWTEGIYGMKLDELRPVLAFTYWLDSRVFGAANAPGYHVTNVALHMLNSVLVFAIARSVAPAHTDLALLAGALFALMPAHAEPIAWISGRVDSLAAAFYLGAFLCFLRFRIWQSHGWLVAAFILFACGLFAKQSIVTFPFLILAYDAVYGPGFRRMTRSQLVSRYSAHVPFFLLLVLYLGLRRTLFGNVVREDLLTLALFKEFAFRQYFYVKNLLPIANDIPFPTKVAAVILTLVVLAGCGRWLLARRLNDWQAVRHLIFFGAIWYAITIAPMIVTYVSARHLYLTAAGLSIALASLLLPEGWRNENRGKAARILAVGVLVALYGVALTWNIRTWIANGVDSHRFANTLTVLLRSLPPGSTVMVGIPETRRQAWFWSWALPFALQTPFMPEDLYKQFAIVERPGAYCCPPAQWWAAKQPALGSILNSSGTHELTYILPNPQDPGSLTVTTRTVSGPALRTKIEGAMGRPVETLASKITDTEAQRLAQILFE